MKPQLKMNQNNDVNNGGGQGDNQDDKSKAPANDPNAKKEGNQSDPPSGKEGLGYEDLEDVSLGEYGGEGLKEREKKPHEKVKLEYELDTEDLEGMSEQEVLDVKSFAAQHKLSKEAAKAFIGSKKQDAAKVRQILEEQKQAYNNKVKQYKQNEYKKLVAAIGGEGGKEFKANLKKTNDFLAQHLPELKKAIDERGVFIDADVMHGIFKLQNRLLSEDPLVHGGQKVQTNDDQPSWQKLFNS